MNRTIKRVQRERLRLDLFNVKSRGCCGVGYRIGLQPARGGRGAGLPGSFHKRTPRPGSICPSNFFLSLSHFLSVVGHLVGSSLTSALFCYLHTQEVPASLQPRQLARQSDPVIHETAIGKMAGQAFKFGTGLWDPTHRFETSWLLSPWVLFFCRALIVSLLSPAGLAQPGISNTDRKNHIPN